MQSTITRLALFQFLIVVYSSLGNGILVKAFWGSPAPPIFATHLRNYGFLPLLVPAVWLIVASVYAHRPKVGTGDVDEILVSGIALLSVLLFIGFAGTMSAVRPLTHLIVPIPKEPPPAARAKAYLFDVPHHLFRLSAPPSRRARLVSEVRLTSDAFHLRSLTTFAIG